MLARRRRIVMKLTPRCRKRISVSLYVIKYSPHRKAFQMQACDVIRLFILGKVSHFYGEPPWESSINTAKSAFPWRVCSNKNYSFWTLHIVLKSVGIVQLVQRIRYRLMGSCKTFSSSSNRPLLLHPPSLLIDGLPGFFSTEKEAEAWR
jgi:hypothetical protein